MSDFEQRLALFSNVSMVVWPCKLWIECIELECWLKRSTPHYIVQSMDTI
jgi:hypothetical protein